jgi:ketosteroid isomerase-like protein
MSQENLERMRQSREAFNRRDRAAWLALVHPDFETVPSDDWPEIDSIRGAEAAWEFYVETDEPWDDSPYEYVELIDAGNDRVIVNQRRDMHGKASGAGVVYDYWLVVTFRDGKALRAEWFKDRKQALAAAGLSAQTLAADASPLRKNRFGQ